MIKILFEFNKSFSNKNERRPHALTSGRTVAIVNVPAKSHEMARYVHITHKTPMGFAR